MSLGLSVRVCVYASMCACDVLLGLFLAGPTCRSECVCVCVCVCVSGWVKSQVRSGRFCGCVCVHL